MNLTFSFDVLIIYLYFYITLLGVLHLARLPSHRYLGGLQQLLREGAEGENMATTETRVHTSERMIYRATYWKAFLKYRFWRYWYCYIEATLEPRWMLAVFTCQYLPMHVSLLLSSELNCQRTILLCVRRCLQIIEMLMHSVLHEITSEGAGSLPHYTFE
jgi:hypothetical protein